MKNLINVDIVESASKVKLNWIDMKELILEKNHTNAEVVIELSKVHLMLESMKKLIKILDTFSLVIFENKVFGFCHVRDS